ncbi:MAG: CRISPR-associated ring nuclease Crn1 [Candidatus Methanomethylicia archaeon]|uniref:CRISPR-associated ring nuclease Crn1 n=1 Tax=Saccharolobus sp. TaxID=2100761 RepID=UPI0031642F6F
MVRLIATLGTSPGGVFESFLNLSTGKYECEECDHRPIKVDEVYIVRTIDPQVELAWKIVKVLFICCSKIEVNLYDIPLKISDITSPRDYKEFKDNLNKFINQGDYVDFTGGRKSMSVAAALVAREKRAHVITTIIPQDEYNRISESIKKMNRAELSEYANRLDHRSKCDARFNEIICSLTSKSATTILLQ